MASHTLPDSSPDQDFAQKLAARELAKYCQEFSRWRRTRLGRVALDGCLVAQHTLEAVSTKKPELPSSPSSHTSV